MALELGKLETIGQSQHQHAGRSVCRQWWCESGHSDDRHRLSVGRDVAREQFGIAAERNGSDQSGRLDDRILESKPWVVVCRDAGLVRANEALNFWRPREPVAQLLPKQSRKRTEIFSYKTRSFARQHV